MKKKKIVNMKKIIKKIGNCLKELKLKMGIVVSIFMLIIIIINKAKHKHWKTIVGILDMDRKIKVKYHNLKSHLFKKDKADQLNYSKVNLLLYLKIHSLMNSHFLLNLATRSSNPNISL